MKCRAYKLYGAAEIARVLAYSRSVVMSWLHDWHAHDYSEGALEIHIRGDLDDLGGPWIKCGQQDNPILAVALDGELLSGLPWLFLGCSDVAKMNEQGSILGDRLLEEIVHDLALRFMNVSDRSVLSLSRGQVDVDVPGSGYLSAVVSLAPMHRLRL